MTEICLCCWRINMRCLLRHSNTIFKTSVTHILLTYIQLTYNYEYNCISSTPDEFILTPKDRFCTKWLGPLLLQILIWRTRTRTSLLTKVCCWTLKSKKIISDDGRHDLWPYVNCVRTVEWNSGDPHTSRVTVTPLLRDVAGGRQRYQCFLRRSGDDRIINPLQPALPRPLAVVKTCQPLKKSHRLSMYFN